MNYHIRQAALSDAENIAKLHIKMWRIAYQHIMPKQVLDGLSLTKRLNLWTTVLSKAESMTYVVEHNKQVIAFISFGTKEQQKIIKESIGEIYAIYVDYDHWGKKLGQQLVNVSCQKMKEAGYKKMFLWVLEDNITAIKFYEKMEFKKTDEKKVTNISPDATVLEIGYQKSI